MAGSKMRRKIRKRKSKSENSRMKMGVFVGIILLAVLLGFLTARFVIGPIIGYNADESPVTLKENSEEQKNQAKEEKEEKEEKEASVSSGQEQMPEEGYALQFGAFSTKDAAEKLAEALRLKGIETKIVEIDDVFKVISPLLADKETALKALQESKDKEIEDVFITSLG